MLTEFKWPGNCKDCRYFHDDAEDEFGVWALFCDLFHGNGIGSNCDEKKTRVSKEQRM